MRHLEFYQLSPYAKYIDGVKTAGDEAVSLFVADQPEGQFDDAPGSDLWLSFLLSSETHGVFNLGAGRFDTQVRRGGFIVSPPQTATEIAVHTAHRIKVVAIPAVQVKSILSAVEPDFACDFGRLHAQVNHDPFLDMLCATLWREMACQTPSGQLWTDSAVTTLLAHLYRQSIGSEPRTSLPDLPDARLARVIDYIDANLGQDLSLADLAGVACLSSYHFARVFKRVTGSSPLSFVQERRIERARRLLALRGSTLAQVSYECGFANQAHFTTVFKRHMGVTPGQYRAEVAK